ncbi:hypothetical protein BC936DRAFT_142465 [Jimgerdemannia flammicorona]|uniref:Uncharacterized protein n=1 Tax=Jimgerdemannia flammicorona TaxID=994334 RepID=A0A433DMD6_9FUNG|nr:hypothetical protein BC936DRAFT_142465 [Jimgerdemannia flammicorona]
MSLPEEEKEDTELVEFHQLGKKIAEFINNKDRLVTLMPAYLLGDINWDTYSLGIRLFMRWQLDEHELQNVNKIIEKYGKAFRGVEQLVFVGVAASDGKPSDGSNNEGKEDDGHGRRIGQNDGKNNIYQSRDSDAGPAENQAQSSRKHQSNEGGDSCSGGVGPSDLDNFGEGSTFLRTGAGGAGRSQNTSGNDDEGGDDGGLSRREEIDSTQLMLQNWSRLFGSFCERLCCCPSEEFRYHRIAEVEENLQLEVLAPSCAVDGSREDVTNECKETITSPLPPKPSHPFDKSCQITLTSSAPESSNEITATAAGLHISTEEIDPDSNACASRPKIMNDIKGTNVSQGINATGSVFHNSNVNVFNENFPSARTHDVPEEPKFTVNVSTFSKATLKGKEQEFTINFILKITISKFSHKLELSKIIFEGGTQHLTDNERYILNNFRIKFSSGTVNASFGNIQPLEKAKDYRRIKHTACRGIYQWHHNIDDVNVLLDLRHDLETHSAEYEWMGAEPTEYSIDIRVNLLVVRNLTRGMRRDIMDIFRKDHDLVNHVSMRVNIPRHDKENIKYETPQCTWKVATEVEHGEQGSGLMNIPNEFSQLSSCTKRCCQLVAGIYAIEHLQCSNKRCKHLINSN